MFTKFLISAVMASLVTLANGYLAHQSLSFPANPADWGQFAILFSGIMIAVLLTSQSELQDYDEDDEEEELVLEPLEPEPVMEPIHHIVSDPTQQAGVDAFGQLAGVIAGRMQLGQGRTVEELVQELLRPLLREWLDQNLPELVDELVKKEIERMVEKANR